MPKFTGFLVKVASRCNLNCDYCYVYRHADQSWRQQPHFISSEERSLFSHRLKEYAKSLDPQTSVSVIFHGGEPLLYGAENLAIFAEEVRQALSESEIELDFSLQTNGVLLGEKEIFILSEADIGVSISLDGPKEVHDLHRLDHGNNSSFDKTYGNLLALKTLAPQIFRGVITVIDPSVSPRNLFSFFSKLDVPRYDILLPDATHAKPPYGRERDPAIYKRWLIEAFEIWFSEFSSLQLRWFDSLLAGFYGIPCSTDVMGFGEVSLMVIDTDGKITDHDVFKIAHPGAPETGCHLKTHSFVEVEKSDRFLFHSELLTFEGLSRECKTCPAVSMCGGGSVMHRYHPERGFDAPSAYCEEIQSLLTTAASILRNQHTTDSRPLFSSAIPAVDYCLGFLPSGAFSLPVSAQSGDLADLALEDRIRIHENASFLAGPYCETITVCANDSLDVKHLKNSLIDINKCLDIHCAQTKLSIIRLISDIVVVRPLSDKEAGIFSFSDDASPNVLYISTVSGDKLLTPSDIADSILHEFLHHVLYHFDKVIPLLFSINTPSFPAPWTKGLRPAIGFFHGTFVFAHLAGYWRSLYNSGLFTESTTKTNMVLFQKNARYGIASLRSYALLTSAGLTILELLEKQLDKIND